MDYLNRQIKVLQQTWGYNNFRYPQQEIITNVLIGKDTLVIMPTGGGKSLCFQLPAIMQPGLTIVVSTVSITVVSPGLTVKESQSEIALDTPKGTI